MRESMLPHSSFNLPQRRGMRGFTLIEVLVAISLLAIVLTSVYGIFGSVNATKLRLDSDSAEYHLARVVFDRLGRELHGAYYRRGDETTLFRGGVNDQGESFLELTTTAVTPLSSTGTGIAEVRYRLAADEESNESRHVLLRSERPRQSAAQPEKDRMMRLAPGIVSLSLRFYTEGNWRNEWDARQDGMPQLVEIALVVGRDEQRLTPFMTTFDIPNVSVQ
jgi:general secretion pathway protein J